MRLRRRTASSLLYANRFRARLAQRSCPLVTSACLARVISCCIPWPSATEKRSYFWFLLTNQLLLSLHVVSTIWQTLKQNYLVDPEPEEDDHYYPASDLDSISSQQKSHHSSGSETLADSQYTPSYQQQLRQYTEEKRPSDIGPTRVGSTLQVSTSLASVYLFACLEELHPEHNPERMEQDIETLKEIQEMRWKFLQQFSTYQKTMSQEDHARLNDLYKKINEMKNQLDGSQDKINEYIDLQNNLWTAQLTISFLQVLFSFALILTLPRGHGAQLHAPVWQHFGQLAFKFVCAFLLHLWIMPSISEAVNFMKYVCNHIPKFNKNVLIKAIYLNLIRMVSLLMIESAAIYAFLSFDGLAEIAGVVTIFAILAYLEYKVPEFFGQDLLEKVTGGKDLNMLVRWERTSSKRAQSYPALYWKKSGFFYLLYRPLRIIQVSVYFYLMPFFVIVLHG